MELYVEKDYYLTMWKKEDGKWFSLTGWSDDQVTWVESKNGPKTPVIPLESVVNDPKHKF